MAAERAKIAAKKAELAEGLPHLYEKKFYRWARAFFESMNKMNLLCAANQIGKSSVQIRKAIHWATCTALWPKLWWNPDGSPRKPRIFFYCYPTYDVCTVEFEKKWEPEFLPRGIYKTHPVFGWRSEYDKKHVKAIHFNSGVSIYFKAYSQDAQNLQTSTCDAVFTDEELPEDLVSELVARLWASKGYFHMVFTATLNQELWFKAIEGKGPEEAYPDAFKLQVSMTDCMLFEDGTPGMFTEADIKGYERMCKSDAERRRRIHGRFISDAGRKYHAFDPSKNYLANFVVPDTWVHVAAVDLGGGGTGHPAAILFLAVNPEYTRGHVYKAWRGDYVETTDGDVYIKFLELRGKQGLMGQVYDYQSKDFGMIAQRAGNPFEKADKSHELGEKLVNTLFQNEMLTLASDDDEIQKLGTELMLVMKNTPKQKAKDDLCDALRYAVMKVQWDLSNIKLPDGAEGQKVPVKRMTPEEEQIAWRRGDMVDPRYAENDEITQEIEEWNALYGS